MWQTSENVEPTVHGALDYGELERLGLQPEEILDFSVNSNPYGPSPMVRFALASAVIERYPDRESLALRRAIQEYELSALSLPLDAIVCGNGTAELIWTIARASVQPGEKSAILGPTFGEYRAACQAVGARLCEFQAQESTDFQPDISFVLAWLKKERPVLVWLCNPNNPTGVWLSQSALTEILAVCQQIQATLVVDEAYWHFLVPHEAFSALALLNMAHAAPVIVLRSLTKDYALAGLRLGYAVSDVETVARLKAQLPAWNVSALAQDAGVAALRDRSHFGATFCQLARERQAFFLALQETGLRVIPSRTHFILLHVDSATSVRQRLLTRKILVRDCTSFGLSRFMRVVTRPASDWQRLLSALQEVL